MDKGLVNGGPEGGQDHMKLLPRHIHRTQAPASGLGVVGPGAFRHFLHPVVLEIGVSGALRSGEQQHKAIPPLIEKAEPPQHIFLIHIPRPDQIFVGESGCRHRRPLLINSIQIRHRIRHHSAKQLLFSGVTLIKGAGCHPSPLADGFQGSLLKAQRPELLFGAVHDPRVNGSIRFCHNIPPND